MKKERVFLLITLAIPLLFLVVLELGLRLAAPRVANRLPEILAAVSKG